MKESCAAFRVKREVFSGGIHHGQQTGLQKLGAEKHDFAYPYKHLNYRYGSHMLLPFRTKYKWLFHEGRQYPKEYDAASDSLREEIICWLNAA
ncbi:MAG: hypothetical protein MR581_06015 [Lachnospiraceae bacterium]|nr:hypothetical protein [Lachnospiraceae bacterium]